MFIQNKKLKTTPIKALFGGRKSICLLKLDQ